ncbi:MAG: hypothetical protein FWF92_02235 [Oscillospiraceae bacterium]|nr:hypothetical protein [Oscillospiraceae bacterium]
MKLTDIYTKEQLKKGVRNPFYHKLNKDVTVGVRYEDYELFEKIAEEYDTTPERIMQCALHRYAKLVEEDFDFDM